MRAWAEVSLERMVKGSRPASKLMDGENIETNARQPASAASHADAYSCKSLPPAPHK